MKSRTETIIKAMRILSTEVYSDDGVANSAIAEAAERLSELQQLNAELESMLVEVNNNRTGVSPCARFCEALASKKMLDNLQRDNRQLKAQVEQLVSDIHNAAIGYLTMGYSVDIESMAQCAYELTGINAEGCHTLDQHNDEIAVDRFGSAMKTKLKAARAKGRSGWDDKTSCSGEHLAHLLIEHLAKGNAGTFEDIANFSMMLHQRGEDPQLLRTALVLRDAEIKAQAGRDGFVAGALSMGAHGMANIVECEADEYANKIKSGEVEL